MRFYLQVNRCREAAAQLFHAPGPECVAFTLNCTEAVNMVLKGRLKPGDHVVVSCLEHNAVMRPLQKLSEERGVDFCRRLRDAGVKTVIYTDISRDGAEQGANLDLYRELSEIQGLDITASGGVSSLEELRELRKIGTKAAILGKALYTGRLDLKTVIREVGAC